MIRTVDMFPQPDGGVLEGTFDAFSAWPQFVNIDPVRWVVLEMGDPKSGPAVTLMSKVPGSVPGLTDDLIEDKSQLAHYHRSDCFRMTLGEEDSQINHAGKLMRGLDFFVMRANKRYTETVGTGNVRFLDIYADRRGMPASMADGKVHPAYEEGIAEIFGALFTDPPPFHRSDDAVVTGIGASFADIPTGGRLHWAMANDDAWTTLTDGSRVAAVAIGDLVSGPVVVLAHNAPGVSEPAAVYDADILRIVATGTLIHGGDELDARCFRAVEAGMQEPTIVHGPDGSRTVLLVADRRHWRPTLTGNTGQARLDEIAAVVDGAVGAVHT